MVKFKNVLVLLVRSLKLRPSVVVINVDALAVAVPVSVFDHETVLVVALVFTIFAGANLSAFTLTGNSKLSPTRLYGLLILYASFVIFSLVPCLIIPSSKSFHIGLLPLP